MKNFSFSLLAILQLYLLTPTASVHIDKDQATFFVDTNNKYLVMVYLNTCYFWHLTGADADHIGFSTGQTLLEEKLVESVDQGFVSEYPVSLPGPSGISIVISGACQGHTTYQVYPI